MTDQKHASAKRCQAHQSFGCDLTNDTCLEKKYGALSSIFNGEKLISLKLRHIDGIE